MLEALLGVLMSVAAMLGGSPMDHDWESDAYHDLKEASAMVEKYEDVIHRIEIKMEAVSMSLHDIESTMDDHDLNAADAARLRDEHLRLETTFWKLHARKSKYVEEMEHHRWRIETIREVWDME